MEAVQQFNDTCSQVAQCSRSVEHNDCRVDEVLLLRAAHDRLRARLREKELNDVADELVGTAWWAVGDRVETGLGIEVASLAQH